MKVVRFYHRETGLFHRTRVILSDDAAVALNTPANHIAIDDSREPPIDPLSQRMDVSTDAYEQLAQAIAAVGKGPNLGGGAIDHQKWNAERQAEIDQLRAKVIVDHQPPQPSPDHVWDSASRRWRLNQAAQQCQARQVAARRQIAALELSQARPMRELVRDPTNAEARKRLDAIEEQIAESRSALGG